MGREGITVLLSLQPGKRSLLRLHMFSGQNVAVKTCPIRSAFLCLLRRRDLIS